MRTLGKKLQATENNLKLLKIRPHTIYQCKAKHIRILCSSLSSWPVFSTLWALLGEGKTQKLGQGHTKETDNHNATAISENWYQTELNTWN
jgi:hypothetical protein